MILFFRQMALILQNSLFMKQSRAACTSDDTVNVYQADTQEIFRLVT